ncbi:MAG: hypothetical protein F4X64_11970 [Chloroflexi bacterium]|nr:hypothetical protein [Chloroflexota bacterium]
MPPDPHRTGGKAMGQAAGETMRHYVTIARLLFKLITVPFWAPFFMASGMKERRRIRAFILEQIGDRPIGNALIRDLTIAWVEQYPQDYPNGQRGLKFDRLKFRFESVAQIIQQRRGY